MSTDSQPPGGEQTQVKPKEALSPWLIVAMVLSFFCMIGSAGVLVFVVVASPMRFPALPPPGQGPSVPPPVDQGVITQRELKLIDDKVKEAESLMRDIQKKEQEREAARLLAQVPLTVRVAAIQFASEFGNVSRNSERLAVLVRKAAEDGARIVVMPECAITGYMAVDHQTAWRDPVRRQNPKDGRSIVEANVADTVPGEQTQRFGELAKELNIFLVITLVEKVERVRDAGASPPTDYFNTAVLLGPDGRVLCHYRKMNLWPPGDATWAQPGDRGLGLCDTPFGKLGLLICYDLSSGVVAKLKDAGATMVLYPVGWVHPNPPEDWFEKRLPEKVKDWGLPLIAANWSVDELPKTGDAFGYGFSSIYGADGRVLAGAGPDGTEVIYADLPFVAPAPQP